MIGPPFMKIVRLLLIMGLLICVALTSLSAGRRCASSERAPVGSQLCRYFPQESACLPLRSTGFLEFMCLRLKGENRILSLNGVVDLRSGHFAFRGAALSLLRASSCGVSALPLFPTGVCVPSTPINRVSNFFSLLAAV
jgi:hypothetical protein